MLMQLSNSKLFFEIDDEDFDKVKNYLWYMSDTKHIKNNTNGLYIHRVLLNLIKGDTNMVDHKDTNTLNNKKENLRLCTKQENARNVRKTIKNKSGYKGVYFCNRDKLYVSNISLNGKTKYLGQFNNPIDAAIARDKAEILYFGEFANLNFSKENYD